MIPDTTRKAQANQKCHDCGSLQVTAWVTWGSQFSAHRMCAEHVQMYRHDWAGSFAMEPLVLVPDMESEAWDD